MAAEPTFLFCIGATKAGTSWLYSFLRGHPEVFLRGVKELHYFDAFETGDRDWQRSWFRERRNRAIWKLENAEMSEIEDVADEFEANRDLAALHQRPNFNAAAYRAYLTDGLTDERVVGDFTPSYALLSTDMFGKMAGVARKTRFVYILRDPVARLWSHIRMNAARRASSEEELAYRARRIFRRFGRGQLPGIWARSDYRGTLERLNAALAPGQLLVLFYEELFSSAAIGLICDFLGISPARAPLDSAVHEGPPIDMDAAMLARARACLADQYAYVAAQVDHLPQAWRCNFTEVPG